MAGYPHYRNSKASMNNYEPVYQNLFHVSLTPPSIITNGWDLVMENVLNVGGLEIDKLPGVVEQTYKGAIRSYAGSFPENGTTVDLTLDFEVNVDESGSMYVYDKLRQWCDLIWNPLTGAKATKKDYIGGPLIVSVHDKANTVIKQIKFPVVFPTAPLPPLELAYDSTDIYKITGFTLRADYWDDTWISGSGT